MTSLLERVRTFGTDPAPAAVPIVDTVPEGFDGVELEPDPAPAPETRSRRTARAAASAATASTQKRKGGKFVSAEKAQEALADELNMWLKIWAGAWSVSDEHCAGVLNETSEKIAADLAKLGARSEWVMEKFENTSILSDLGKLAMHLGPLIKAIWAHHGPGAARFMEEEEQGYDSVPVVDPHQYGPWRPQVA